MGSAILFTAARMQEIEDGTVTSGLVDVSGNLILTKHDGTEVNAGFVVGPSGTTLWGGITDKPESFPPSAHNHSALDITTGVFSASRLPDASTTVKGIQENADTTETITGTALDRTVTPAGLAGARDGGMFDTRYYTETEVNALLVKGQEPTVVVGSGSASASADGLVTFNGCSYIALDDVFDGVGADVYEVIGRFTQVTGSGAIYTRMRKNGVVYSGSLYNFLGSLTYSVSGPARSWTFGTNVFGRWHAGSAGAADAFGRATFYRPKAATQTNMRMQSITAQSDRYLLDEYGDTGGGPFDGFQVFSTSGTISGTVKVVKIA